jgi:hypothetical protein
MTTLPEQKSSDDISIKELILNIRKWIAFIFSKWKIILVVMAAGGIAGYFYARSKDTLYQAESTFVLDEGKSGGSALSGLAFLGMGGGDASVGLFSSTQNIIWLYKSRLMLHQTLLSQVNYGGKKRLLIDIFLDENGLRKKIDPALLKNIDFKEGTPVDSLNAGQSNVMLACIGMLKGEEYLEILETNKAENLITISFKSRDEQFSKLFTEVLVNNVNQYYIATKTKKTNEEIKVLERKADSARMMLNANMYEVASSIDAVPNANPLKMTLRVAPQRKKVDVDAATAMYIELAKNLETRRMALAQETPLIQIVDGPVYPLNVIKPSSIKLAIMGALLFAFLTSALLILIKWYRNIMGS